MDALTLEELRESIRNREMGEGKWKICRDDSGTYLSYDGGRYETVNITAPGFLSHLSGKTFADIDMVRAWLTALRQDGVTQITINIEN